MLMTIRESGGEEGEGVVEVELSGFEPTIAGAIVVEAVVEQDGGGVLLCERSEERAEGSDEREMRSEFCLHLR
jgi:hypothetical protein